MYDWLVLYKVPLNTDQTVFIAMGNYSDSVPKDLGFPKSNKLKNSRKLYIFRHNFRLQYEMELSQYNITKSSAASV